jgi:hypothetical protein
MTDLLIIEDATVIGFLRHPGIISQPEFAFLSQAATQLGSGRCGSCQQKRAQALNINGLKQAIANLDHPAKAKLKTILNARQCRIVYRDAANKQATLTF